MEQRSSIIEILGQLADVIAQSPEAAWRLFPPRFDDPARQAAYELESAGSDSSTIEAIEAISHAKALIFGEDELRPDQADFLMRTLNRAKLILATLLGIENEEFALEDDASDQRILLYQCYEYFQFILSQLIDSMAKL